MVTRFRGAVSISGRAGPRLLSPCVLCFILLDSRRYQRERWSVIRCNERLAVNVAPIPYRGLGIALRFTSKSYKRRADKRTSLDANDLDLMPVEVDLGIFRSRGDG